MNDGVRRSLLIAQIAKLQVEDEAELAGDVSIALNWGARPGWGTSGPQVDEWIGEAPSRVPMVDRVQQGAWGLVDGRLQGETSKA